VLNPENTNPAFAGRDLVSVQGEINTGDVLTKPATSPSHEFVSAQGEIDTDGATTNSATSPNSDEETIAKQGSPVNSNYRGEVSDISLFSRASAGSAPVAPTSQPAKHTADDIINAKAATARPVDAVLKGITHLCAEKSRLPCLKIREPRWSHSRESYQCAYTCRCFAHPQWQWSGAIEGYHHPLRPPFLRSRIIILIRIS